MTRALRLTLVGMTALCACTIERRTDLDREEAPPVDASEFLRPWGETSAPAGVRSGNLVWVWAMPGIVPGSAPPRLVEGGISAEARQALENVSSVMQVGGASMRDVAQCSVFVADSADVAPALAVYSEYFPSPPLRTAVAVAGLGLGARMEIECTAVVPPPA